jgi:hypothetical protein
MNAQTSMTDGQVGFVRRPRPRIAPAAVPTPRRRPRQIGLTRPPVALPTYAPARAVAAECPTPAAGPGYRLGRWARLALTVTTLAAAILLITSLLPASSEALHSYTVRPGDTLWSIATATAGESDPAGFVARVRALNDLGDQPLVAGMQLQVPGR